MPATFSPELATFLAQPVVAHVSTTGPDGRPQASVVWFEHLSGKLRFFANAGAAKVRNIRRDPRVVVVLLDPSHAQAPGVPDYVRVTGDAQIVAFDLDMPDRLAVRYGNAGGYPFDLVGPCVGVDISATRVSGFGRFA